MFALLSLLTGLFLLYSIWSMPRRPGLIAACLMNSYPMSIHFGPSGAMISMLVWGLVVFAACTRRPSIPPTATPEILLLAWFTYYFLSMSWAVDLGVSFSYLSGVLALCGASYFVGRTFGSERDFMRDFLVGCAILVLLLGPSILLKQNPLSTGRLTGGLAAVGIGTLFEIPLVGLPVLIIFLTNLKWWFKGIMIGFLGFAVVPLALANGTRSVILAAGVTWLVMGAIWILRNGIRMRFVVASVLIVCAVIGSAIAFQDYINSDRSLRRIFALISIIGIGDSGDSYDASNAMRLDWYRQAFVLIESSPLIGHGAGGFAIEGSSNNIYPHQMVLEMLTDTGVIGAALLIGGIAGTLYMGLRGALRPALDWALLVAVALLAGALVRQQVSMNITMAKVLFFAMGVIVARTVEDRRAAARRRAEQTEALQRQATLDIASQPGPSLASPPYLNR
ncbi:O-antigen ligase family protein [Zavarzinia sp. CC-PAN008]|uniref:O-antigen ligase family protein n=1 Tax=Zavarzinia sp. CC-PAN008 TaxID=3243332 RepID=UPI003F746C05